MKGLIFAVEGIRDDSAERPLPTDSPLDQVDRNLRLGAEGRVSLAVCKPGRRRVGLNLKGILDLLVGPKTGDSNHAIVNFAQVGDVLAPDMCRLGAILTITAFINDEHAMVIRCTCRVTP